MNKYFTIFIGTLFTPIIANAQIDTTKISPTATFNNQQSDRKNTLLLKTALAGIFTVQHNWYDENNKSIALLFNMDYSQRITTQKFIQYYQFRSALGFMKLIKSSDSVKTAHGDNWIKNNDYWRGNVVWTENASKHFTHTYSVQANSQFLVTKKYIYNYETDKDTFAKTSTFFNPGNLTIAYGLNWTFWDYNYINFNFATIKVSTKPRFNGYVDPESNSIAKTTNAYIYFEYGMNLNTMIYKKINENVEWENYTYYFMNGISRKQVHLDFMNRIIFKFLKYIQFRFDTHIIYEPLFSYRLQYQQDFTLGFVYELRKRK